MADSPMKNVRGPLTPDEREYYRHVASFNAITQGDRLMVQPCRDVLALDSALRAALERAEKAEAVLTGYGVSGVGSRIEKLLSERDAALAKLKMFENRRKLAYSLRAESPQVAAFVEAIGAEMDKIGASPLRSKP